MGNVIEKSTITNPSFSKEFLFLLLSKNVDISKIMEIDDETKFLQSSSKRTYQLVLRKVPPEEIQSLKVGTKYLYLTEEKVRNKDVIRENDIRDLKLILMGKSEICEKINRNEFALDPEWVNRFGFKRNNLLLKRLDVTDFEEFKERLEHNLKTIEWFLTPRNALKLYSGNLFVAEVIRRHKLIKEMLTKIDIVD